MNLEFFNSIGRLFANSTFIWKSAHDWIWDVEVC